MSEVRTFFPGSVPSTLRVEFRSDGAVRLSIDVVGATGQAVVDLEPDQVADLIGTLHHARLLAGG